MGIMKPPAPPPPDPELERQIKMRREEEEKAKKAKAEKDKELKWSKSQGMVGTRSLFSKAGGKGFFYDGMKL